MSSLLFRFSSRISLLVQRVQLKPVFWHLYRL